MVDFILFLQQEFLLFGALAVLVFLFFRRESAQGGDKLSLGQVVQAMNSDKAVLLDIRETKEFNNGHVANAINIVHSKVEGNLTVLDKHREKQIIVADKMGQHAAAVTKMLAQKGFNVARMRGGMSEWTQEGLPLVK